MLYSKNKKIIKIIRKQEPKLQNYFYDREDIWEIVQSNKRLKIGASEFNSTIETLIKEDFIRYANNSNTAFALCDKGRYYYEYCFRMFRKYVKDKWIDFFSLLLSVISLVVSIISICSVQ